MKLIYIGIGAAIGAILRYSRKFEKNNHIKILSKSYE